MRYLVALFLLLAALPLSVAKAGLVFNITESGSNVVATGSGSVNLTGLTQGLNSVGVAFVSPGSGIIAMGPTNLTLWTNYSGISGPTSFGAGSNLTANAGSGSRMGINGTSLVVPVGYVSGTALNSSSTWTNTTISGLGLTPGTYTWTWSSDSVTMNVTAVPEPSSLALLGLSAACVATRRRWRGLVRMRATMP